MHVAAGKLANGPSVLGNGPFRFQAILSVCSANTQMGIMHISKLSAVALALAIPSLVIPTSATAFVPSVTVAAVVDATTPVDDPVLKAATTEPPEDATPEDPMNGYNGQVQLGGDAEDLGFTLPKTILIPWEGEESELSPDQLADLEDAGVDLSAEQPEAPVEPIPDELVERAGACEMELGENVRDALEQCADDTSASASSNEDSATRRAASPMAAAAFDTGRAETRMSSVAQTNDPGDESGEEDVSEDDELPPGTAAGWGIQLDQPATSPCVTNQEQQLYITRTSSCFAYDVWAGVYQAGTGSIIGTYILTILNTTTTQASGGMVISNATSIRKSQPSGAALNRTMNVSAAYGCSTPGCSTSTPNYRGSSDGWWNTAKGSTTMNLSSRSAATVTENWKITISLSGLSGSGTYNGLAMKPRCDNAAVGLSGKGCVFANYVGWFKTPTTGETAQVGQHIVKAAAAGLPQVLTRADPSQRPINSRNTCPSVSWLPRDAGYQCDEYPFASTVQGGSTNVMVPQGCRWQATSPAGYGASRCMVLTGHNSKAGTLLGNFYRDNRIRPGDKFFVQVA